MLYLESLNLNFKCSLYKEENILSKPELAFRLFQIFFAEFLGTLMLVFWSCSVVGNLNSGDNAVQCWLHGIIVYICFQIFGPITNSHINPAVTLTFFIFGYVSLLLGVFYILAQILGAMVGYFILRAFATQELTSYGYEITENFCAPKLGKVSVIDAFILEAIATGIICLLISRVCNPNNRKDVRSIALEMCIAVFAINYTIGDFTGAAYNPVRFLAPAVFTGEYKNMWVYWAGPITGSLLASISYHIFFLPKVNYIEEEED